MILVFANEFLIENCNNIPEMCIQLGIEQESLNVEGTQNLTLEDAKRYGLMHEYKEIVEVMAVI